MSRCVVLMYHVIDRPRAGSEARFCVAPAMFREHMQHLSADGWNVIPLAQLVQSIREARDPPSRSVVITFDDGTACTHDTAMPVLAEFAFAATVFAVSHLVDGCNEWMIREGQPSRAMLGTRQLRALDAAGIDVGSHTARHAWLARIPPEQASAEARDSKQRLEDIIGKPVRHLAYPYGNHDEAVRAIVRQAGYEAACTTRWGKNGPDSDPYALRRIEIMGGDALWQFRAKLLSGTHDMPPWSIARTKARDLMNSVGIGQRR